MHLCYLQRKTFKWSHSWKEKDKKCSTRSDFSSHLLCSHNKHIRVIVQRLMMCVLSVDSTNSSLRWSRHLKRGCRDNMNSVRWEACHTFWVDFNNGFWAQLRLRFMLCCDTFFLFTVCDDSNMTWTFGLFPSQLTTLLLKRKEGHIVFAFSNKRNQRRKYCIEQLGETTWTCYNLKV